MKAPRRSLLLWICAALLAGTGLYVASFVLVCQAVGRGTLNAIAVAPVYRPMLWLRWNGPDAVIGPIWPVFGLTADGINGCDDLMYAAGYRDNLGGVHVYRVDVFVAPAELSAPDKDR